MTATSSAVTAKSRLDLAKPMDLDYYYGEYRQELCRYATQKFGMAYSEAEDVVQSAYTRLASMLDGSKIDNVRAFLYRTVHNACIDQIRRRQVRENYSQARQHEDVEQQAPGPERTALSQQFLQILSRALTLMPGTRRKFLLMNRIDGLSYAEIARREGLSETVVRKHVSKALADCQKALRSDSGASK